MRSWGWEPHTGIGVFIKINQGVSLLFLPPLYVYMHSFTLLLSLFLSLIYTHTDWGHRRKAAMSASQKEGPTRTCFAGTFISHSPRLSNFENICLLFKPPSLEYFCYSNLWWLRLAAALGKGGSRPVSKSPMFINFFCFPMTKVVINVIDGFGMVEFAFMRRFVRSV